MDYETIPAGKPARDKHARAFIARWSRSAGGELGNFQMFYTELADVLGVPRPEPSVGGTGDYVFERAVTFPDGSRGRADLFKVGCFVLEAKCFGGTSNAGSMHAVGKGRRRTGVRRGTPAWERAMKAAARQGAYYARALASHGLAPPYVIALDIGYALDLYRDFSGTGHAYVRYPPACRFRIADLVREEVRQVLRLVLSDPFALDRAGRHSAGAERISSRQPSRTRPTIMFGTLAG